MCHTGAEAVCAPWQRLLRSDLHAGRRGHTGLAALGFATAVEGFILQVSCLLCQLVAGSQQRQRLSSRGFTAA